MENTLPVPTATKPRNIPTVFIIFGATGDLMKKKIIPSLFHLYIHQKLPKLFRIIGFSRRDITLEEFKKYLNEIVETTTQNAFTKEQVDGFVNLFMYQKGDFQKLEYYKEVASNLGIVDGGWQVCSNKLFYLAVPPQYYKTIFENLAESGLTIPCGPDEGWTRVIVEKPFGNDLKTAEDLDTLLGKLFKEEQIYRIDHYLAKQMLQNILSFRFANSLFEEMWNRDHIERIDINLLEDIGVEGRGPFYESLGALRDVGQNHLLQMLALITMEAPKILEANDVRKKRAEILETLKIPTREEVIKTSFRGQYKGYLDVKGVEKDSTTETYFKVKAFLEHPRWKGVPITLQSGKRLQRRKDIIVSFKHPEPCLCPPNGPHYKNRIIFSLEPREGITIEFWSKKPGLDFALQKRNFNFLFRNVKRKPQYIEEYEKLIMDCITGNQLLFISTEEIEAMWRYTDPILEVWEKNEVPLIIYKPDSRDIFLKIRAVLAKNRK